MRAASIKPRLALRSLFAARSDGCSLSAFGTRLLRDSGTVWVVDDEGARDESVIEESASAMLWVSLWEMRGETFNTGDRPGRERWKRATTETLRRELFGEDGRRVGRARVEGGMAGLAPGTVGTLMSTAAMQSGSRTGRAAGAASEAAPALAF